jgi:hypothetical protein
MSLVNFFMPDNKRPYYIILPVLVFIIVPGFVLQENYSGFSFLNGKFTIVVLISAAAISCAMLFLLDRILALLKLSSYFGNIARFTTYLFMCTGLIAPLSVESGMIDPGDIPVDWYNLVISLLAAAALYTASSSRMKKYLAVGLYCFLGINLVTSLLAFHTLNSDEHPLKKSIYSTSSTGNIFVISFDGLPRDAAIEVLQESPELNDKLRDFIIYQNVISSSPATEASIFAELQGNWDFKQSFSTTQDFSNVDASTLLTNHLDHNGFMVSTYGRYNFGLENKHRTHRLRSLAHLEQEQVSEMLEFFNYTLVRIASSYLVIRQDLASPVKDYLTFFITKDTSSEFSSKLVNHKGKNWDKKNVLTKFDYDTYVDRLSVSASTPTAHFLHFTHTHFPVDFNRNCEYMSHDQTWYSAHQSRNGAKEEMHCVFLQFAAFIDKLKKLGIYDQSLIVFKSDHGKPVNYHDGNKMESFRVREHELWGYGRYTPFLAIKGKNRHSGHTYSDDNPVMLDDLAKTICLHAGIDLDCTRYKGYDLLADNLTIPSSATSVIFIVNNSNSSFRYDTHEALHLHRKKDFFSNVHHALSDQVINSEVSCHETIRFKEGMIWNNGFADRKSWAIWHNASSSFLKYRPGLCKTDKLLIDFHVESDAVDNNIDFDLLIDGIRQDYKVETTATDGTDERLRISVLQQHDPGRTMPVLIEARPDRGYDDMRIKFDAMRQD